MELKRLGSAPKLEVFLEAARFLTSAQVFLPSVFAGCASPKALKYSSKIASSRS